jgi:hypothetical protein
MTSAASWRKAILQHRNALRTVWHLAFPVHDFASLRLIQAEPITPWPNEDAWARAARAYHEERKRNRSKVPA